VLYPETDYEQHEDIQNIEMHSDDSSKVSSLKITSHLPKVCRHKQARDAEVVLVIQIIPLALMVLCDDPLNLGRYGICTYRLVIQNYII
jgi:hypothetical protein